MVIKHFLKELIDNTHKPSLPAKTYTVTISEDTTELVIRHNLNTKYPVAYLLKSEEDAETFENRIPNALYSCGPHHNSPQEVLITAHRGCFKVGWKIRLVG